MIANSRKGISLMRLMVVIRGHGDEEGTGLVAWLSSVCLEGLEEREREGEI